MGCFIPVQALYCFFYIWKKTKITFCEDCFDTWGDSGV